MAFSISSELVYPGGQLSMKLQFSHLWLQLSYDIFGQNADKFQLCLSFTNWKIK